MTRPDFSILVQNAQQIVEGIGKESVDVYHFLSEEFKRGPVTQNHVFQFVYRSFYRLDNAGLTPEFKYAYFDRMECSRFDSEPHLKEIATDLRAFLTLRGYESLQFSFVTKLANTINPTYPIYDSEIAKVFGFRVPYSNKPFDVRLREYLDFYQQLRQFYEHILTHGLMKKVVDLFCAVYSPTARLMPPVKVLDFIFWSTGKVIGKTLQGEG